MLGCLSIFYIKKCCSKIHEQSPILSMFKNKVLEQGFNWFPKSGFICIRIHYNDYPGVNGNALIYRRKEQDILYMHD